MLVQNWTIGSFYRDPISLFRACARVCGACVCVSLSLSVCVCLCLCLCLCVCVCVCLAVWLAGWLAGLPACFLSLCLSHHGLCPGRLTMVAPSAAQGEGPAEANAARHGGRLRTPAGVGRAAAGAGQVLRDR